MAVDPSAPTARSTPAGAVAAPDPAAILRSRQYVALLVLGALVGIPVAVVAYFFLALVAKSQTWVFTTLPTQLGFGSEPTWWPVVPLVLCGLLVALSLTYLPGTGGHEPADGFKAAVRPNRSTCPASWSRRWRRCAWGPRSDPRRR